MFPKSGKTCVLLAARLPYGFNQLKTISPVQLFQSGTLMRNYIAGIKNPISIKETPKYKCSSLTTNWMNHGGCFKENYSTESASTETATTLKLTKREQLKRAFKEYGATIVVFHVVISVISLGGFYALVSSGINLVPILEYLGVGSSAFAEKVATGSTFVVAFAVHKIFAPARISITLGTTPFIVRYLRSKGFLKPKST
ncbi:protein FAM210B, mitochondrial [Drosophila teissieri]|uniref:protein FAM210B, mitochondrial n=1 Tax=Drosophila teissieri TaxID=7243 RepID=UPI001CB9DD1F|nr:protein FAM210B, mitochondrial [Drosophila teissieri]